MHNNLKMEGNSNRFGRIMSNYVVTLAKPNKPMPPNSQSQTANPQTQSRKPERAQTQSRQPNARACFGGTTCTGVMCRTHVLYSLI